MSYDFGFDPQPTKDDQIAQLKAEIERLRILHDHLVLYGQEQQAEIERLRMENATVYHALAEAEAIIKQLRSSEDKS